MSKTETTRNEIENVSELSVARDLAKEFFDKSEKLQEALNQLANLAFATEFQSGWLSPSCRYEIKLSGKYGYKEIDALIQKLEVDKQTFQDIEWTTAEGSIP